MANGIPLKVSIASETFKNFGGDLRLSIAIEEKGGKRSICGSPLYTLSEEMTAWSVVRLAEKTNTTFFITVTDNKENTIKENKIELSKDGYKRFDQDQGTKARTTAEPRRLAWLDVKIVNSEGQLSIISQSGPNDQQADKDATLNTLFTKTLGAVLNVLGCNPTRREALTVKEEDRGSPVSVFDL